VTKGYAASAALLLALTAGCASDGPSSDGPSIDGPSSGATQTAEPTTALLDWTPVPGSLRDLVVVDGAWTITVPASGGRAVIDGPNGGTIPAGPNRRIDEVLSAGGGLAVVVAVDELEERPQRAIVVDLANGMQRHEVTDPVPAPGGSWSLHDDVLHYATYDGADYCLATASAMHDGTVSWCQPKGHGFSQLLQTDSGLALMSFDDERPACRRLFQLEDHEAEPEVPGVPQDCSGYDIGLTGNGAVWSTIPNEHRIESADFHALADGATYDLGPGNSGSLTSCGDSLFFTRDAARGEPARLLRWTGSSLEVAYESPGTGEAFLEEPVCAGTTLTVTAYGEGGDERVSATVPG
jgi:hypothetical protein